MPDVEPRSILASAIIAASLDLSIDKNLGQAWIIPYRKGDRKLAQFQLGTRGITQLAHRSAAYERMNAKPVNSEALNGYDSVGEPVIDWSKLDETKEPVGYVFTFKLKTGFIKTCYWTKAKMEAHAKRYSPAYRAGYDTPWKTHFTEMAIKTIIANELRHWGILSIEMQKGFTEDQGMHADIDAPLEFPEAADEIAKPKFDAPSTNAAEEKQLAAAGLAPEQPPTQPPQKPKRAKKVEAPTVGPPAAASPTPSPTTLSIANVPAQPPAPLPAQAPVPGPATETLFQSEAYRQLRNCMTSSGVTDAEVIHLCRHRGVMTPHQEELLQLSDAMLTDLVNNWTIVAGQIRQDRKRTQ